MTPHPTPTPTSPAAPLWASAGTPGASRAMRFMVGDDLTLDGVLLPFDIRASIAHVRGLGRVGALAKADAEALAEALESLRAEAESGERSIDARFEDGHSAIEWWLTERLGDLGKRVHLGRSRNDQSLVAIRLFMRDGLERVRALTLASAKAALDLAAAHEFTPMPGYTHLQRAVPSSAGLWMGSFAESFLDDAELIDATLAWIDRCPLGTAAGYGVNIPLDRRGVAEELGFSRLQLNPMSAQASRGKHEAQAISCLWQIAQTVRRLAWDLTLFSAKEFGFVAIPQDMSTGSSIMPGKRNPDVPELLRANASILSGALCETMDAVSLPSGYHRDLQRTKGPIVRAVQASIAAMELVPELIAGLTLDETRMRSAIDRSMHATDEAVRLAASGMPFRDAYRQLAEEGVRGEVSPESSIRDRVSPGACGALGLNILRDRLRTAEPATSG